MKFKIVNIFPNIHFGLALSWNDSVYVLALGFVSILFEKSDPWFK